MAVQGSHLILQDLEPAYSEHLYEAGRQSYQELKAAKPSLMYPMSRKETKAWIEATVGKMQENQVFAFVIQKKDSGEIAGYISTYTVDWLNKNTEIGYWIATPFTGRGFAKEAIVLMLEFLFSECSLHRVCARTPAVNQKNRHILEKLKFSLEGELLEAGYIQKRWMNLALYSMISSTYKNIRSGLIQDFLHGEYPKFKI
jgi:ribosomal-protein-serine acetyltransferase